MAACPYCKEDMKDTGNVKTHVCISKNTDGHIHVHGNIDKPAAVKELLEAAVQEAGISLKQGPEAVPAEVVFHNRQRIGDMLVFTCAVRDFKAAYPHVRVNVIATAMHIFDHNKNIDRTLVATPQNTIKIGPGKLTNSSNRLDWHFTNAFRVSIEDALSIRIPQGESRPDIWLTQEEYDAPPVFDRPYWVICTSGEKGWGCKMYPHSKWQEVVNQNPDLLFVQIGTAEDNAQRLVGPNVIDYIGQTQSKERGIRDLFKLFLNAEGSIGLVSFHMHLSGALYKPAVIVAGAREPVHFTRYPGHAYLSTDGMLPCATKACWHCDIKACTNPVVRPAKIDFKVGDGSYVAGEEIVPKCVDIITPEDITRAIRGYYEGGRLVKGQFSDKPKLKNVVPTPPKLPPVPLDIAREAVNDIKVAEVTLEDHPFGLTFGGGAITHLDWNFIHRTIKAYNVKKVLEFGAGLSTLMLNKTVGDVITFETSEGWIKKVRDLLSAHGFDPVKSVVCGWKGDAQDIHVDEDHEEFDLAFVDGPAGGVSREAATRIAAARAKLVIVHDAGREHEKIWQEKYLQPAFFGPIKGGHRCHLWIKNGYAMPNVSRETLENPYLSADYKAKLTAHEAEKNKSGKIAPVNPPKTMLVATDRKFVKVVSTARGWGGCARSVTTIMRMLVQAGHKVEFIPFRNAVGSREYREILAGELKDVIVSENYNTLGDPCDALLVYADDYVWEFQAPEMAEVFADVKATRKVMALNYRRGKVGQIPWTQGWDKYLFLNSTQEAELLKVHPGVKTRVLTPCTDLAPFFEAKPDYERGVRIVRHSSQGDTKFGVETEKEINSILDIGPDARGFAPQISMVPGPSFVPESDRFKKLPRISAPAQLSAFLESGNLFWYSLPDGYMDMGPRVILEAMAAGLPVMADNWGGAADRVTPETGWLVKDKSEYAKIVSGLTVVELRQKGEAARARARAEFVQDNWITELIG